MLTALCTMIALNIGFALGIFFRPNHKIPGPIRPWDIVDAKGKLVGRIAAMTADEITLYCDKYFGGAVEVHEPQQEKLVGMIVIAK